MTLSTTKAVRLPALGVAVGVAAGASVKVSVMVASSPMLSAASLVLSATVGATVSRIKWIGSLAVLPAVSVIEAETVIVPSCNPAKVAPPVKLPECSVTEPLEISPALSAWVAVWPSESKSETTPEAKSLSIPDKVIVTPAALTDTSSPGPTRARGVPLSAVVSTI